jgi:hypothetical protein
MSHGGMDNDLLDRETQGLLVQLLRETFGPGIFEGGLPVCAA